MTNGGNPVYLPPSGVPEAFRFLGRGAIAGIPVPLIIAAIIILGATVVLTRARFGRVALAIGIQASVVRYSGIAARAHVAVAFILAGLIAAVAGLILSATVTVYIPSSGSAFLLNAIGATFIGTTLSRLGRPNIPGTVLGVLLLGIVANGLLLTGLNFYWQQVGTGLLIFAVLALSFNHPPQGLVLTGLFHFGAGDARVVVALDRIDQRRILAFRPPDILSARIFSHPIPKARWRRRRRTRCRWSASPARPDRH